MQETRIYESHTYTHAHTQALEPAGPLDFILNKVNFKKLGVAGGRNSQNSCFLVLSLLCVLMIALTFGKNLAGAFFLADVVSGLVMGRSFFKIVSGNADPGTNFFIYLFTKSFFSVEAQLLLL
jgi:hypothetical protein